MNKEISQIFKEMVKLLEIRGDKALSFKIKAYGKAINILENLKPNISEVYKEKGLKGIQELGIGEKNAKKIEEYIKRQKIKEYDELAEETAIQNIIAHFFATKGVGLQELKNNAKKRKIIYSRFTKPAKQLLELAGSVESAKEAISKVANWAKTRKLDYAIETIFKKWLELDQLKPKEVVKKPFYKGNPMYWVENKKKWFVVIDNEWLEFCDKEATIEWRIID
jgi:DNA polymerase/3'-5' exonuclease PolX